MPSPFPGMDPYLEDPIGWPDVHLRLIATISELLAPGVEPDYYVRIEERVYITDPDEDRELARPVPDVIATAHPTPRTARQRALVTAGGALDFGAEVMALPSITPHALFEALYEPEVHDRYLEVRDRRSHEVVTAIELLSPVNKVVDSRGRETMQAKRTTLLRAGAHWMEIDLLRQGDRPPLAAGRSDYRVTLYRPGEPFVWAWFVDLRDRLPVVAVPLRDPHPDVALDLQQALDTAYDRARYAHSVDNTRPIPPPRLGPADAAWAAGRVAALLAPSGATS